MSLASPGKPARRKSVWGHNTGTTIEDVYTCPANCRAEVTYILVSNSDGGSNTVTVTWYDDSDSYTSSFVSGKNLSSGEFIQFDGIDLVLEAGDKIQIQPSSAGHVDSIVTVTETFVPVG
jgi:hypothetical protein